jgi:dTDP-4-dehydrorhamnose 3,5-epimerase
MATLRESEKIADVIIVEPQSFGDDRGRFLETYRRSWFPLGREMVQSSRSDKVAGSLVGLHYHLHQADYWYVTKGVAQVVLHDLRIGSVTEGATLEIEAGDNSQVGIYIPPGVAHGFAALTDMTLTYLVDNYYNPSDELGVAWDDPEIAADWKISDPVYSERDANNPVKRKIKEYLLPRAVLRT